MKDLGILIDCPLMCRDVSEESESKRGIGAHPVSGRGQSEYSSEIHAWYKVPSGAVSVR